MSHAQVVSGKKPVVGNKAKPAFGRKKVTRADLFFDREAPPAPYQRPAIAYSPGFTARYMVPCKVGEHGKINANLSELCGFLRSGNVSVIGKMKVVEIEAKRGRHMRRIRREVIDPGPDCEVVVFTNMTTPHCYALKSQVVSGL